MHNPLQFLFSSSATEYARDWRFAKDREGTMVRVIITAFGLTALATSAIAADLPVKAPPPPPAPVYLWSGCYIGGNVGWARAETKVELFNNTLGAGEAKRSADGVAGGGQIGCDYQFSTNWVVGIQGMFDGTSIDAHRGSVLFPAVDFHARADWFGTGTVRLGYLITPSFLIYGKGGWGGYRARLTVNNTITNVELGRASRTQSGADAGAGFEWMFSPNWSLWVEWDHIFPEDKTVFFPNLGAGGTTANIRRDFDKVLVGVNWRFGGVASPVRAAY
jgi:outer membrane immunogenic protein